MRKWLIVNVLHTESRSDSEGRCLPGGQVCRQLCDLEGMRRQPERQAAASHLRDARTTNKGTVALWRTLSIVLP